MPLRDVLGDLADATRSRVLALWASHEAGTIDRGEFVDAAAAAIAAGNERAAATADVALAVMLARRLDDDAGPAGVARPDGDADRLAGAVDEVLDADIDTATSDEELRASRESRLGRLAAAEPLAAGQDAFMAAMAARRVSGWVRVTDPDPCPLCATLADGRVRPPTVQFARHPGCGCIQRPVMQ